MTSAATPGEPAEAPAEPGGHAAPARVRRESSARALLVVTLSGSLFGWSVGWDFGAFGIVIGYRRFFAIAVAALVVLVVSLTHPRTLVTNWRIRLALLAPIGYVVAAIWLRGYALAVDIVSVILLVLMLPLILFTLARILALDFFRLNRKDKILSVVIILAVTVLAGFAGANNDRLVTCDEFEHAGDYVPANCDPG
ncbi:MAG: hypothetical protein ACK5MT_03380 [Actinomycetales bacterium]